MAYSAGVTRHRMVPPRPGRPPGQRPEGIEVNSTSMVQYIVDNARGADMATVFVTVGREEALMLLDFNTLNRPLKGSERIRDLAKILDNGNGVAGLADVSFCVDGILANGQHILNAIVLSGVPLLVRLTVGLPVAARVSYDNVNYRNLTDAAYIRYGKLQYAGALKTFYRHTLRLPCDVIETAGTHASPDPVHYLAWLDDNVVHALAAVKMGAACYNKNRLLSNGEAAIAWHIIGAAGHARRDEFFAAYLSSVRTGTDSLGALDSALAGLKPMRSAFWRRVAVVIRAYNNWAAGAGNTTMGWDKITMPGKPFPVLRSRAES